MILFATLITVQIVFYFIRGFTRAAFGDSGNTPEDNVVLTILAIGPMSTSCHSLTNHVGMGSASQKAFEDLFSSCLISLTVSMREVHDLSTDKIYVDGLVEGNPLRIVIIFCFSP